ncbi:hypothetical protein FNO01nite_21020 [Flavobacterium noncentrifugens]|nr:hypothetical protein FNO01nite_21020 [Flavobacterium noncentrifugens]
MTTTASYTQSFDTLNVARPWTNDSSIKSWYAKKSPTATFSYFLDNGGNTAANLYSYGTTGANDRALGGLTVDATPYWDYGMQLQNTSGNPITNFSVAYTGEQWRAANTVGQSLFFYYKISTTPITDLTPGVTTGWTAVSALNFASPKNTTAGALDGNLAANRTVIAAVTLPTFTLPNNSYIMIKWEKTDVSSGSNHGLAIDDVKVNWTTVPLCTAVTVTSVTPTAGPVGTEVTINAASGLNGATATFNGIAATVVSNSATKLVVTIPTGASSGNLIVTNAAACAGTPIHYDVTKSDVTSCSGSALQSDLFISEVTDSNYGALTYVELYNNTGSLKTLSSYILKFAFNGNAYSSTYTFPTGASIANGATYVIAFRGSDICSVPGGDGSYANDVSYVNAGINFETAKNDHIALFSSVGSTAIDVWGVFGSGSWVSGSLGTNGASFKRKNTVSAPSTIYSNADWNIIDFAGNVCANNDYTDIGHYEVFRSAPTVNSHPSATIVCATKNITLSVTGTEGFSGLPGLEYKWYVAAPGASSFVAITDNGTYSGSATQNLTITGIAGLYDYQYYCQIRENLATCYTASNAYAIKDIPTATWSGSWSPSAPTSTMRAIFNTSYSTATANIEACSCEIKSPAVLTITSGKYVEIQNDITNAGTIDIQNNGSLIQVDDAATINGLTKVTRDTTPYEAYDFTYWSSPITAAVNSTAFSNFRYDHTYSFLTVNYSDLLGLGHDNAPPSPWINESASAVLTPGRGYIVRGSSAAGAFPRTTSAHFDGILNNGVVTVPVTLTGDNVADSDDYNLVGNPYASAISADNFIDLNTNTSGTLYFWTHVDNISTAYAWSGYAGYSSDDYAVYTKLGGTGTRGPIVVPGDPTSGSTAVPAGSIASGQGFFIKYDGPTPSSTVTFNNSLRSKGYDNTQFYKANGSHEVKDRIWLNLQNPAGMFSQQLIGYIPDGTIGYDRGYDGLFNNGGNYINFYSLSEGEKYKIQGRPSFNLQDAVALGYSTIATGPFEISIDNKEGVFEDVDNVYIEDRLVNVVHDLKQSPYLFTTESGTFNDRFVLKYKNQSLGNEAIGDAESEVSIVSAKQKVTVHAVAVPIKQIAVFDILGRKVYDSGIISQYEFAADHIINSQQALIVKVILENGRQVTKKIMY